MFPPLCQFQLHTAAIVASRLVNIQPFGVVAITVCKGGWMHMWRASGGDIGIVLYSTHLDHPLVSLDANRHVVAVCDESNTVYLYNIVFDSVFQNDPLPLLTLVRTIKSYPCPNASVLSVQLMDTQATSVVPRRVGGRIKRFRDNTTRQLADIMEPEDISVTLCIIMRARSSITCCEHLMVQKVHIATDQMDGGLQGGVQWLNCHDKGETLSISIGAGGSIVAGSSNNTVKLFDGHQSTAIDVLHGHTGRVTHVASDRQKTLTFSSDGTVKVWSKTSNQLLRTLPTEGSILCGAFLGPMLVSGTSSSVHLWDFSTSPLLSI
eukprot:gene11018-12843_t